ncbi:MAG: DNA mismatch repair endonuclease MutL [Bacilli bacterium]|jgi:DNA mismatch repair protein MutL|nr:DNA mismatch repair endonuclease MutL [Bacilli bacterium]
MSKIHVLDIELANQIAAGEVIERPSSVVKELVENALDANANNIAVYIVAAGREEIRVEDNGEGMSKEDAVLAFSRHATSKISSKFDLFHIKTLGFRGEALPSISSVANVELLTSQGDVGTLVKIKNNVLTSEVARSRKGTIVKITNLFYNTPARLKYLKADCTENANTIETFTRLALAHPEVAFSLYIDNKLRLETSGRGDLKETIMNLYGLHVAKNLVPFSYKTPDYEIEGYLGKAELARSNRYSIIVNLNGRNVYMPKVQAAIIDAYHDFLAPTRYPFVVLNFKIEPALVDFNVHPTKKEVRFSKETELRLALIRLIPETLLQTDLVARPYQSEPFIYEKKAEEKYEQLTLKFEDSVKEKESPIIQERESEVLPQRPLEIKKGDDSVIKSPFLQPIGQLNLTYIVCEDGEGGFCLIDQHAAMERINYEHFQDVLSKPKHVRSPLTPLLIDLTAAETQLLTKDKLELLLTVGIKLVPFGINSFRVEEVPIFQKGYDEELYVRDVINIAINENELDLTKLYREAISSMACKASIRANQFLSISDMKNIIDSLSKTTNPYTCPHGRPVIIRFTKYELEKMFKRTGT